MIADSECPSECSCEGNFSASTSQSVDLKSKSCSEEIFESSSSQLHQLGELQPAVSLTEVEVDRPQSLRLDSDRTSHLTTLDSPRSMPSLNVGVRSTDL